MSRGCCLFRSPSAGKQAPKQQIDRAQSRTLDNHFVTAIVKASKAQKVILIVIQDLKSYCLRASIMHTDPV